MVYLCTKHPILWRIYIYIYALLLCNNILKNDTTLRATKTDPLLLFTYCTLLGDRWLEFAVPKADAEVLNKPLPYKANTRNKQSHDLLVFWHINSKQLYLWTTNKKPLDVHQGNTFRSLVGNTTVWWCRPWSFQVSNTCSNVSCGLCRKYVNKQATNHKSQGFP